MRVVFSAVGADWDSLVDPRLGRAKGFVVYDDGKNELSYISNDEAANASQGAGLQMAKLMLDMHADVIITGNGPGEKASDVLNKSNIKIYVGAGDMSLKDAYKAYQEQKLTQL